MIDLRKPLNAAEMVCITLVVLLIGVLVALIQTPWQVTDRTEWTYQASTAKSPTRVSGVTKQALPKTRETKRVVSRGVGVRSVGRMMVVTATAYSPGDPTQGTGWRTAVGRDARLPGIAVDPRVIPLGSMVRVPGFGWLVADDTGRAIKGARIDVRLQNRPDCMVFGKRSLTVEVME